MAPMGGGLMQLVAYGATDVYLSGDSYRVVYRRHTNFSYESTEKCFEEITKNRLILDKERMVCPIEYTNINIDDKYLHCSKCNHNFCNDSITKWLNINKSCPMCRNKWSDYTIYINKEDTCDNANEIDQIDKIDQIGTIAGVKTQ